jgi:hypothetical protein
MVTEKEGGTNMSEEKKSKVLVRIGDDVTTFDRIFCSGKVVNEDDKNTTLIYGYQNFDHFVQDYVNVLCTAFQFLEKETDSNREEVLEVLKGITADIFDSIESGEYVQRVSEIN